MRLIKGIPAFIWKVYVGIVFSVFALLLYPLFLVVLSTPTWKKLSFRLFVLWSWIMRFFCFYHVKKVRNSPLPKGPYILISNHSSYLDIFLMYSIFPEHPFLFLGKGEILSYPIISTYFRGLNIPVHRKDRGKAAKSFIQAKKEVKNGWSLVIFPEGGIPNDNHPQMIPFKKGAFHLAKALEIPIVPVTFTNHYRLFSDPMDFLGGAHPGVSRVYIHPFITAEKIAEHSEKELSDLCFNLIEGPLKEEGLISR
jgi:1-acyl-sn-glycerol-3-phosphate acyltransferase